MRIVPTFLGAHEIPLEHRELARPTQRDYVDLLVHEMIPRGGAREARAFRGRVLRDRRLHRGREPRDSPRRAASRAAAQAPRRRADVRPAAPSWPRRVGATSADHLARSRTTASKRSRQGQPWRRCFPGRCCFSGRPKQAPARRFIEAGVPVALATDFNPGTSPTPNVPLDPDARRQPAAAERRRSGDRRDGERGGGAWRWPTRSARSRRAFRPISRCSTSAMCVSCRTGTATTAAWRLGCEANLVTLVT